MSKEGFKNEKDLELALNNKRFSELNKNLKNFIQFIFRTDNKKIKNEIILCKKLCVNEKGDLVINFINKNLNISVKMGTGNSVHQEPIKTFIEYLNNNFADFNETIANDIKFFVWGDGTLDGSGKIKNRLSATEIIKKYPKKIKNIKCFFEKHIERLLKRFLLTGKDEKTEIDYIYYGDVNGGYWASKDDIIKFAFNNKASKNITVGVLNFQAWNRNINGGNKSEKKRGVIQLKWGLIGNDIKKIMRKYE